MKSLKYPEKLLLKELRPFVLMLNLHTFSATPVHRGNILVFVVLKEKCDSLNCEFAGKFDKLYFFYFQCNNTDRQISDLPYIIIGVFEVL